MNISGIRPSAGFYDYNTIKSEELSAEQTQKTLTAQQSDTEQEAVMNVETSAKPDTRCDGLCQPVSAGCDL